MSQLRRLTHSQYNHTVRDLLGDQTAPAKQFPPEDFVNGFLNQSRGQSLSPLLMEAYSNAAEKAGAIGVSRRRYARADSLQAFAGMREAVCARVRTEGVPAAAGSRGAEALRIADGERTGFPEGRAAGGGGDAAIAELPVLDQHERQTRN